MDWDDLEHIAHLEREIEILRSMLQPSGTGHIHTAIRVLETRVYALHQRLGYYDVEELEEVFTQNN